MPLPSFTVVVPNYNHARLLPQCLDCIMSQSVLPSELILIDDGSTDDSLAVMRELQRKYPIIQIHQNDRNRGVLCTINRGMEMASGEYLLSQGADDLLMPGFIEKSLGLLAKHPQAAFCGGICEFQDMGTGLKYYHGLEVANEPCYLSPDDMICLSRQGRLLIFNATMILRRKAAIEVGKYNPELRWHADWFLCYVAGFRHGVCFVPEVMAVFQKFPSSYSSRGMSDPKQQTVVLRAILEELERPEFRGESERIAQAAAMAHFGKEMLWLLLRDKKFRRYLTPAFLRQNLWWIARWEAKKILPVFMAKWYFKLAGYANPPKSQAARPNDPR